MNNFLKSRQEIDISTKYLQDNGYFESGLSCKNWEISEVIPHLKDGNIIDLGSDGSVVLPNVVKLGLNGQKVGIDLAYKDNKSENGIDLIKGDLMNVPYQDGFFNTVVSLSTIEHSVDLEKFAKECSRLLSNGGKLFVSFDFWNPKPDTSKTKLYSLDWNILDESDVLLLVLLLHNDGLKLTSPIDWRLHDAVINDTYCSPAKDVAYTFGILSFVKQ